MRGFLLGVVAVLTIVPIVVGIWLGLMSVTTERQVQNLKAPFPVNEDTLLEGMRLYVGNCSLCHGLADGQPSPMAQGFYSKAPQVAADEMEQYPEGMLYWWAEHGIRFSPMPAFQNTIPSQVVWKTVMFIKSVHHLPPAVDAAWKAIPRSVVTW